MRLDVSYLLDVLFLLVAMQTDQDILIHPQPSSPDQSMTPKLNAGFVRHSPKAMFETYSRQHNNGIYLGFIKPLECRMAGEHITLLCLLRLKNALRSTIMSKEFIDLKIFHADCTILMNPDFWKLVFVMCRVLYAPMRVLCLAGQKTLAMDKLFYYVLQTD